MKGSEIARSIDAFGGTAMIHASGEGVEDAVEQAATIIRALHDTLTRFDETSELCRLNADPRTTVSVSPIMLRFVEAVRFAGELSGGLVDATCLGAVERSGYTHSLSGSHQTPDISATALRLPKTTEEVTGTWRDVEVDVLAATVTRPPGLRLDAGGLGKGMAADMAAESLFHLDSFAVECLGELRFGGVSVGPRPVRVASPDSSLGPIASLSLPEGAVATSGITKRSWMNRDGEASHHLIDPRTGEPVYSGVIQATALAPTAVEAEIRAKSALISGPEKAMGFLPNGGVIVLADLRVETRADFIGTGEPR